MKHKKLLLALLILVIVLVSSCEFAEKECREHNIVESLDQGLYGCLKDNEKFGNCYICCSELREPGIMGCDSWQPRYCLEVCR